MNSLDLSGNPLLHEFYRLYSVYYLQKLKVLDGAGVDVNERSLARERYSGLWSHRPLRHRPRAAGQLSVGVRSIAFAICLLPSC